MIEINAVLVRTKVPYAYAPRRRPSLALLDRLLRDVCGDHGVSEAEIASGGKAPKKIVAARWDFMAKAREADFSLLVIGGRLRMDHTSVIAALRRQRSGEPPYANTGKRGRS